jgi:hypothetical protein
MDQLDLLFFLRLDFQNSKKQERNVVIQFGHH